MKKQLVLVSALALTGLSAFAQENDSIKKLQEVVISDSKFALAKEKSGKIITKITASDLSKKAGETAASILSTVAGVEVNGNHSNGGKNLEIYTRGGRSRQALILIDGIPVTDASGINLTYDLRLIPVEQIESIEIMNGAASTLYGTSAATSVINIKLKKSGAKKFGGEIYSNIGTQRIATDKRNIDAELYNQGVALRGNCSWYEYFTTLNHTYSYGISEAIGREKDSYEKLNAMHKSTFNFSKKMNVGVFANYDYFRNNFDGIFDNFNNSDLTENNSFTEQFRFGVLPKFKYNKGEVQLNAAMNTVDRTYNTYNVFSFETEASKYKSRSIQADLANKYQIFEILSVIAGGQFQYNEMNANSLYEDITKNKAHFNTIDPYLNVLVNTKFGLNINNGIRLNMHSVYGNHLVHNVNPSFQFQKFPLKLIANYGTAYITPSLYQLYSPYGNLNLKPEENMTLEAGFDASFLNQKVSVNAVGFHREEKNSIDFYVDPSTFEAKYVNVANNVITAKGVETNITIKPIDKIKLSGNYTFIQNEEKFTRLLPKHKVNAALDIQATSRAFVNLNFQFVDKRRDAYYDGATFANNQVNLKAYKIANATVCHELFKDKLTIFGTVTNILNEEYTENVGYNTLGRNFKIGFNFTF